MVLLPYGSRELKLRIPEGRFRLVEPAGSSDPEPALEAFRRALAKPVRSPTLEELTRGRMATYLFDDATRSEPHDEFIGAIVERLAKASHVRGIVATGSHERLSAGNKRIVERFRAVAEDVGLSYDIGIHDCEDPSRHVRLGVTSRGTPVEVSREALEADVIVMTSDVKNHYFAGYSNALKEVLPGVSSFAAIEHNHSFALDAQSTFGRHPWHPDPARRTNPVAEDMLEAFEMATAGKDVFLLAALTTTRGVLWAEAGSVEEVTREAIRQVDSADSVRVAPARCLIVSPGGNPEDETLYNAQRGLELSRYGVRAGGEVLFIASCDRGVAPTAGARAEFYDRLTAPLDEVLAGLQAKYTLYSHKAYKFAQFIKSVRSIRMVTELPAAEVMAAHMTKVEDPQAVVDGWLRESDEPILINLLANKVALYL